MTTAHLTREICPRDLKYRKTKTNMAAQKLLFSLSVRDWIKSRSDQSSSIVAMVTVGDKVIVVFGREQILQSGHTQILL